MNLNPSSFFLAIDLEVVNKSPSEIPRLREGVTQQGRHLCLQLSSPTGTGATAMQYIQRTNQLAVGFSDGSLQLWNLKTLKKEWVKNLKQAWLCPFCYIKVGMKLVVDQYIAKAEILATIEKVFCLANVSEVGLIF